LGVFRPQHRIYAQLASNYQVHHIFKKQPKNQKTVLKTAKTAKIHFCRQKISNFSMDQFSPFWLKKKVLNFFYVKLLTTNRAYHCAQGIEWGIKKAPLCDGMSAGRHIFF
jgi:hypothetical protein